MKPAWQNNGYSQGTSSIAFLEGSQWGMYEGRAVVAIMGIASLKTASQSEALFIFQLRPSVTAV